MLCTRRLDSRKAHSRLRNDGKRVATLIDGSKFNNVLQCMHVLWLFDCMNALYIFMSISEQEMHQNCSNIDENAGYFGLNVQRRF